MLCQPGVSVYKNRHSLRRKLFWLIMEKIEHETCWPHCSKDSIKRHSSQQSAAVENVHPHEEDCSLRNFDEMVQSAGSLHIEESKTTVTSEQKNHVTATTDSSLPSLVNDKSDKSTIFVGNLHYKVTWKKLKAFFSKFGHVAYAKIVKGPGTNRSKRYGFVEFSNCEEAHRALKAAPEELWLFGRNLQVNLTHRTPKRKDTRQADVSGDGHCSDQMASAQTASHINILTDDSLVHVFEFLTLLELLSIERVCRRWQQCVLVAARQKKFMILTRQCPFVTSIEGGGFYNLLSKCCNLVSLDISSVVVLLRGIDPLKVIAKFGKHIERLNISGVSSNNKSLEILARECTELKSLTVKNCSRISEKGFQSLFILCKHLEHLDCTGNSEFTGKCLKHATSTFRSLNASDCARLTSKGILNLVRQCPLLETLRIEKCGKLDFETIHQLTKSLPGLKVLCCGNWYRKQLQQHSADHFVHNFVNAGIIVELKLVNCALTDDHLQLICAKCPLVSHLDISCNVLTDVSVVQLADLEHLQYLSACELSHITDMSLENLARQGKLRQLWLQGCFGLTDRLMQVVAENCLQLEELDVAMIPSISVVSLASFCDSCPRRASTSQLYIYTSGNDFDWKAAHKFLYYPNLFICDNYRPLYSRLVGFCLRTGEVLEVGALVNQNIRVQMLAADLLDCDDEDSDDDFVCSDDGLADDFLDNDDFLAQERWNLS